MASFLEVLRMPEPTLAPDFRTRDLMLPRLRELRTELAREGVLHAALFGSVARGEDVPESDLDVILDLDPAFNVGIFQLMEIRELLESRLGRAVDVGTRDSLRRGRHDEIFADLVEVF